MAVGATSCFADREGARHIESDAGAPPTRRWTPPGRVGEAMPLQPGAQGSDTEMLENGSRRTFGESMPVLKM